MSHNTYQQCPLILFFNLEPYVSTVKCTILTRIYNHFICRYVIHEPETSTQIFNIKTSQFIKLLYKLGQTDLMPLGSKSTVDMISGGYIVCTTLKLIPGSFVIQFTFTKVSSTMQLQFR